MSAMSSTPSTAIGKRRPPESCNLCGQAARDWATRRSSGSELPSVIRSPFCSTAFSAAAPFSETAFARFEQIALGIAGEGRVDARHIGEERHIDGAVAGRLADRNAIAKADEIRADAVDPEEKSLRQSAAARRATGAGRLGQRHRFGKRGRRLDRFRLNGLPGAIASLLGFAMSRRDRQALHRHSG